MGFKNQLITGRARPCINHSPNGRFMKLDETPHDPLLFILFQSYSSHMSIHVSCIYGIDFIEGRWNILQHKMGMTIMGT